MTEDRYSLSLKRKVAQFLVALVLLLSIWILLGFEIAVIVGLAMNSADLNETRENIANLKGRL